MSMTKKMRPAANVLAAMLLTAYATVPALAVTKGVGGALIIGPQATVTTTNGILTLSMESTNTSDLGDWTVTTGASHPNPGQNVLFPIGTSYFTLRDATASIMYANTGSEAPGLAGYTFANLSASSGAVTAIANGFRAAWTIPSWTVTQDVTVNGTTLSDTNVQQTVTVCNTSGAARQYGVRFMWDWFIAGNDASFFRQRNPDTAFTNVFTTFNNPGFPIFEETNNISTPLFTVFGTVGGGPLIPTPTQPEQLRYSSWGAAVSSAWDFTNTGSGSDSATEHYWGFNAPLTLAAGGCASYTEYLTTNLNAAGGGGATAVNIAVPTLSTWGLLLLITLIGGISLWSVRRKRG
jgi:hypothetical protein